jgi:hypothetical protein
VAEKKPNRLAGLVKGATSDIAAEEPLRRGRGLEGMLGEAAPDSADMSTSQQVTKQESKQAGKVTSKQEEVARTVKSYRIRDDLAYRIDVLAATERRKIYEIVEEAFDLYLRARDEERAEQG